MLNFFIIFAKIFKILKRNSNYGKEILFFVVCDASVIDDICATL